MGYVQFSTRWTSAGIIGGVAVWAVNFADEGAGFASD
jgi:hypothetical protein